MCTNNAPVNILPTRGTAGIHGGFRHKTIPDRREFDKLMESGSRVIYIVLWPVVFYTPSRLKGGDLDKKCCL